MNYQKADGYSLFPRLAIIFLVIAGLVAVIVLVTRFRPAWLLRVWLGMCLLTVVGALALGSRHLRDAPLPAVAEILFTIATPTGLTTMWLHYSRRHAVLSRLAVQFASAVAVFVCGLTIAGVILESIYAAVDYQ